MTGPPLDTQDPESKLLALRAEAKLAALRGAAAPSAIHQAAQAPGGQGRLRAKNERLNKNDIEMAAAQTPSYGEQVAGGIASLASEIPGAEAAQAGARALTRGETYRHALSDIHGAESDAPKGVRVGNSLLGSTIAAMATPGDAVTAGGRFGALSGLGQSDPNAGFTQRLESAGGRGVVGAGVGAVANALTGGVRAALSPGGAVVKKAAEAGRADVADPLYAAVRATPAQPLNPEMQAVLQHPDIAPTVNRLHTLEQFKGVPTNDPNFLMAVRKTLSDWGHQLDKQGAVLDPSKPNMIAELKDHVGKLKDVFDKAADTQVPGFANAVSTFADESVPISGQQAGYEAMRRKMSGGLPSWDNLGKKTPDALMTFLDKHPAGAAGAKQGVLAAGRGAMKLTPNLLTGFGTIPAAGIGSKAATLLDAIAEKQGVPRSVLQKVLLAFASGRVPENR